MAARAAAQALTLSDLVAEAIPLLKRGLRVNRIHLGGYDEDGHLFTIAGDLTEVHFDAYVEEFMAGDPIQKSMRLHQRPRFFVPTLSPEWPAIRASGTYRAFYRRYDLDYLMAARISGTTIGEPGFTAFTFFRARSEGEFSPRDIRALARVMPAFEAVAERSRRVDALVRVNDALEIVLESANPTAATLALDARGTLIWASPTAERLLAAHLGGRRTLPDALVGAARRLASFVAGAAPLDGTVFKVSLGDRPGAPLQAELRIAHRPGGEPLIIVHLHADDGNRFGLSPAETAVLRVLAFGRSNAEIARQLFVSVETVKSHVQVILQKLGVRSRLEAALMCKNHSFE